MSQAVLGATVRRQSTLTDIEGHETTTVAARVDGFGFGLYQWLVVIALGCAGFSEIIESSTMEPLNRALSLDFVLAPHHKALLPTVHFLGGGVGLALAGPMCDWYGRKSTLMAALVTNAIMVTIFALLPSWTSAFVILAVRCGLGFTMGLSMPTLSVLLAESCPTAHRYSAMYALHAIHVLGYMIGAVGLHAFMPGLGEDPTDKWRLFCLFASAPALLSLPLVTFILCESPLFYAAQGDATRCLEVLNEIARMNGKPAVVGTVRMPERSWDPAIANGPMLWLSPVKAAWTAGSGMIALLSVIDGTRAYMVSGSCYLWPQLFVQADTGSVLTPSIMMIIASTAPLVGLALGSTMAKSGASRMTLLWSVIAAITLALISFNAIRASLGLLLALVLISKMCYEPIHANVMLLKVEAFPTEVRATSFALVSIAAKFGTASGPILSEYLRSDDGPWFTKPLVVYLQTLMIASLACGILAAFVNIKPGVELEDFAAPHREGKQEKAVTQHGPSGVEGYGSCFDVPTTDSTTTTTTTTSTTATTPTTTTSREPQYVEVS